MRAFRLSERGFTFVEILITLTFLSIALLALTSQFPLGLKMSQTAEDLTVETNLAQELMEEIRGMLYWADPAFPANPLGPDGEANRWAFNDVDDYDGLDEYPPYDVQGNPMDGDSGRPNFLRYRRTVSVDYADAINYDPTPIPTSFKRIEVTVSNPTAGQQVVLSMIVTQRP
jgi:MSHA pilin protein MshD